MAQPAVREENCSVLIVGAGPVGLVTANLLGLYGISTLLIERNEQAYPFPRAISIDDEGLRICQALGLRSQVLQHVLLDMNALYLSHGKPLVRVQPVDQRNGYPLISTFDQPGLEATLLAGLHRFPMVTTRFACTLESFAQTPQNVSARIRMATGEQILVNCDYLVACDGGKSFVRQELHIPMRGSTFPQRWLVVDQVADLADHDAPVHCITFSCDIERPTVQVYAPHGARRWEFMLLPSEDEQQLQQPATVQALIQHAGGIPSRNVLRQTLYTFHASYAATFVRGRVFLLGDAAHLLPPFGGQGMNCGLRDAHNLAWKLAMLLRGQAAASLLNTYQPERLPHARQMIGFSAFMGHVVMPTNRLIALLRDSILKVLLLVPPIARSLVEMRVKPVSRYRKGFVYRNHDRFCRQLTGQLLPQPHVLTATGDLALLDDLLGPGFALLSLSNQPSKAFQPLNQEFWRACGIRFVTVAPISAQSLTQYSDIISVIDEKDTLSAFMHHRRDIYLLIRPDRYIAAAFCIVEERSVINWVQTYIVGKIPCGLPVEGEGINAG